MNALANLLLESAGRARHQLLRARVDHQDRSGVRVENVANPAKKLGEKLLDIQPTKRRVRHHPQITQTIPGPTGRVETDRGAIDN
jgi:hypothetical protein